MPPQAGAKKKIPTPSSARGRFGGHLPPTPRRPLPIRSATLAKMPPRGLVTPPHRHNLGNFPGRNPTPRLDSHPNAPHTQLGESAGACTPHTEDTATIVADPLAAFGSRRGSRGYTSSQPLPDLEDAPVFPIQHTKRSSPFLRVAPAPFSWELMFLPEHWVYTDGSVITGHPRLGAAVMHIPTNTTIYIDAAGT